MSWRKWAGLVALAGVLLHAAVVARHNASALAAALAPLSPASSTICGYANADDNGNPQNQPAKAAPRCPICAGLTFADAAPAPDSPAVPSRVVVPPPLIHHYGYLAATLGWPVPSSRAPPV